jgi:hypothetical protein
MKNADLVVACDRELTDTRVVNNGKVEVYVD